MSIDTADRAPFDTADRAPLDIHNRAPLDIHNRAPLDKSNWIIPGKLLASSYPGDIDDNVARQNVDRLLDAGIRVFLLLVERHEALKPFHSTIIPNDDYFCDVEVWHDGRHFIIASYGISDRGIASDDVAVSLARLIVKAIESDMPVCIACKGGKGRTGTIAAIAVALYERVSAQEALNIVDRQFQTRVDKGDRAKRSPQTRAQIAQVKRVINIVATV